MLDNFEQLVDAAPAVSDLLSRAPGVTVLVTSQAALRLSEEHEVLDELEALVDRSLVVRAGERFGMLESIHEFARERLADDTVTARHAAWALGLAEAAEANLEGPDAAVWLRRLDDDHENLVAAAEHAAAAGDAETAQRLTGALWRFWLARGAVAEGRRLVGAALAAGTASPEAGARAREARVVTNLGVLHVFAGEYEAAQAAMRRPRRSGASWATSAASASSPRTSGSSTRAAATSTAPPSCSRRASSSRGRPPTRRTSPRRCTCSAASSPAAATTAAPCR